MHGDLDLSQNSLASHCCSRLFITSQPLRPACLLMRREPDTASWREASRRLCRLVLKTTLHLQPVGQGRGSPGRLGFNLEHWSLGALPPFPKSSRKEAAEVPRSLARSGRQPAHGG